MSARSSTITLAIQGETETNYFLNEENLPFMLDNFRTIQISLKNIFTCPHVTRLDIALA